MLAGPAGRRSAVGPRVGDPLLGSLTVDTFGFTFYQRPQANSPLVNTGWQNCSVRDQRGAHRVGRCDIGAVEYNGLLPRIWMPRLVR